MRDDRQYIRGESAARTILRREVASGCPICRSAFLTYHHFDPPWRKKKHWNPDGMIALCREHHDIAEGGHYTIEYLRGLKRGSYSIADVKKGFPWSRKQYVVRVGGIYLCGSNTVLSADGEPVIQISRSEDDLLSVSFVLRNEDGHVIARMDDNFLSLGPHPPHDLLTTTTATRIKVWSKRKAVAMDLSLKKMTLESLDSVIEKDRSRAQSVARAEQHRIEELLKHLPPEILESIESSFGQALMPKTSDSIAAEVADFRERMA